MKLAELLKKITPLPWQTGGRFDRKRVVFVHGNKGRHVVCKCDAYQLPEKPPYAEPNATYLTHAANVLPQVVGELHSMLGDALKYPQLQLCDHHKQRLIAIITRAETVLTDGKV